MNEDRKFLIRLLSIATMFAYEAVLLVLLGWFLGGLLDDYLERDSMFTIILMVVFALAAVRNFMVRVYRLGEKKDD